MTTTTSYDSGHFRAVNAARRDGRARHVTALVLAELRRGVDPEQIAREAGMGLRTLRRYLARHDRIDLVWALAQARAGARR